MYSHARVFFATEVQDILIIPLSNFPIANQVTAEDVHRCISSDAGIILYAFQVLVLLEHLDFYRPRGHLSHNANFLHMAVLPYFLHISQARVPSIGHLLQSKANGSLLLQDANQARAYLTTICIQ
jgi:hypothetical protein